MTAETPSPETSPVVAARALSKHYGSFSALADASFDIPLGRIVGIIGANGAGKTTLLNAILGLIPFEGEVEVLGMNPAQGRDRLMENVCFIADVATLPRWMRVAQLIDFVEGVHPRFDRARALHFLERTKIPPNKRISKLSKGMITQLHLAVVMAIDARLLVLDEPTLGLDILYRKTFYRELLEEYFDHQRTILVTTHQVEEIEHILTDVMFIKDGRIVFQAEMDSLSERFVELEVSADRLAEARALGAIHERSTLGKTALVFEDPDREALSRLGTTRGLDLADIFIAKMSGEAA